MSTSLNKEHKEDFLIELGTEELPPKALKSLSEAFTRGIISGLEKNQITFTRYESFAAPRRLALLITGLDTAQPDQQLERKGPAIKAAYDAEGNPSKAALGFARANGVHFEDLEQEETPKGTWLVYRSVKPGEATRDLLPEIVTQSLDNLPIPKRMRWGASRTEFVRPVHWLLMLQGNSVIDCEILGLKSGNTTRGHRFHAHQAITITKPADYAQALREQGKVIASFDTRREIIREQVEQVATTINGHSVIDPDLLDEVTALNEWPVALCGRFDEEFLSVPSEALISSMKGHQKYFHVENSEGKLLPHFITVANIESSGPRHVVEGNEKVIRPRLADAKFFYDTDRKKTQDDRREKLKPIVFQAQLGSVFAKTERIARLSSYIAETEGGDAKLAERAGQLCKSDLVSEMVLEFPELQGIMGQYYADNDGENPEVSKTLYEQYMPRFAGDQLPSTLIGCAVAIADKVDTITGIFGINQLPTGSKDPFALRRASIGVLRIIVEKKLNLDLVALIDQAIQGYQEQGVSLPALDNLNTTIVNYMLERFDAAYQEEGIAIEIVNSVKALRPTRPLDFDLRIKAITRFNAMNEADALASANKRVSNILAKAGDIVIPDALDETLLREVAEIELAKVVFVKKQEIAPALEAGRYAVVMDNLAALKEPVDRFFDQVLVNAEEEAVRLNRYALLKQLRSLFLQVADISLLQKS
ncbi:glycine--tRNA ligase subunit beta [Endozoicomonas sp. SCSIO W0465]|uniref:glycine--tRNA ligase subunit beta n=1 Tax=Endozoicomonas sp. SCSIO W0465 TaxID=2918516 RepID=UPI002076382C|nr:glycine--tRNA ligase subunit beta [Endozoicomonas sp. SCSIO W0465]USE39881.1 glycine--tRNA ligase subunit beta [Endozoicomonas sp. SCSIO W0465]